MQVAPVLETGSPEPPPKPRVWPVLVTFVCVFVGMQMFGAFLLGGGLAYQIFKTHPDLKAMPNDHEFKAMMNAVIASPWFLITASVSNAIAFCVTGVVACRTAKQTAAERLRLAPAPATSLFLAPIQFLAFSIALEQLVGWFDLLRFSRTLPILEMAIRGLAQMSLPVALFAVAVLPGIGEELFFRGFIQTRLTARWGSRLGIVVTALLFGLMHGDPVHSSVTFFMGLSLGWIYERTGSLWPSIAAHAVNNAVSTLMVHSHLNVGLPASLQIALALLVAGGVMWLMRQQEPVPGEMAREAAIE
jgi:membrane protease YdiL (CAAX protease family)